MKKEDKKAAPDTVTMRKLAPTLRYEGLLLAEMAGTIATFAEVPADVLLLAAAARACPSSSPPSTPSPSTLPHNRRVRVPRPRPRRLQRSPAAPTPAAASRKSSPRQIRSFFAQS